MNFIKDTNNLPQKPPNKLGEILLAQGLIRSDQLETALREQKRSRRLLGETLILLGFLSTKQLYPLLGFLFELPYVDLDTQLIPDDLAPFATPNYLLFAKDDQVFHIAMGDPHNVFIRYQIEKLFSDVKIYIADPEIIRQHATRFSLQGEVAANQVIVSNESVIDLAQDILGQGIQCGASDIHFLPQEKITKVLARIDGILVEKQTLHQPQWLALKSHFKILSNLDLAENRRPQDGRITINHPLGCVDCRLSFIPTYYGESLVIRLLDQGRVKLEIEYLGFLADQREQLTRIVHQAQGLFIIAGPTGSGKTTTLYGLLRELKGQQKNIITVEEPIEYRVEGIRQAEVKQGVNTFGDLLRAMLRHDPDVIYISEIRDFETAQTAIRAAMTGHLVFSTLHANSACLIPQRLRDLGVSLSDLSGTLVGLMSQRLIRTICPTCAGKKCKKCSQMGYLGRRVIAEILPCNDEFRTICDQNLNWNDLRKWRDSLACSKIEEVQQFYLEEGITDRTEIDRIFGVDLNHPNTPKMKLLGDFTHAV